MKFRKILVISIVGIMMLALSNIVSSATDTTYYIIEVDDFYDDNSVSIQELRLYDSEGAQINYSVTQDEYDSNASGQTEYWNHQIWDKTNLYDGDTTYSSYSSTIFNFYGTPNSGAWTRFAIEVNSIADVSEIAVWTGGSRIPHAVRFYQADTYDLATNIQQRDNSGLTYIGEINPTAGTSNQQFVISAIPQLTLPESTNWAPIIIDDFESGSFSTDWDNTYDWSISDVDGVKAAMRSGGGTMMIKEGEYSQVKVSTRVKLNTGYFYPFGINSQDVGIYPVGMYNNQFLAYFPDYGYKVISDATFEYGTWYDLDYYFDGSKGIYQLFLDGVDITNGGIDATTGGVTATKHVNVSAYSGESSGHSEVFIDYYDAYYLDPNMPQQPQNVVVTNSTEAVALSWDEMSDADSYIVKRSNAVGGLYTTIASDLTTTTYTDSTVETGTYFYGVVAVKAGVESAMSTAAQADAIVTVPVVSNVSAIAGDSKVDVAWDAFDGATEYRVYRSEVAAGPYTQVGISATLAYQDTTVTNDTTYYYVVTAYDGTSETSYSGEVSVTPERLIEERALLIITFASGVEKEYDMSKSEIEEFIAWLEGTITSGSNDFFIINLPVNESLSSYYNLGSVTSRKQYVIFNRMDCLEIIDYRVE